MKRAFFRSVTIAVVVFLSPSVFPTPAIAAERLPKPDTVSVEVAREKIRREYDNLYSSKKPDRDDRLTETFLENSDDKSFEPAMRNAFLMEVLELAMKRGKVRLTTTTAKRITDTFDVDRIRFLAATLDQFKKVTKKEPARRLAEEYLDLSQRALETGQYGIASSAASRAVSLAKGARDKSLGEICAFWKSRAKQVVREHKKISEGGKGEDDHEFNTMKGRFLCIYKNDWEAGLPLLASGSDETLKTLALEEGKASEVDELRALADQWQEAGAREKKKAAKTAFLRRALHHYQKALEDAAGLDKGRINRQLADVEASLQKTEGSSPSRRGFVSFKNTVALVSANKNVGDRAEIVIDGREILSRGERGLNVVAYHRGKLVLQESFDTHDDDKESDRFADAIDRLQYGSYVVIAVQDEANKQFNARGQSALESLGAGKGLRRRPHRSSYYCIGMKGLPTGQAIEEGSKKLLSYP